MTDKPDGWIRTGPGPDPGLWLAGGAWVVGCAARLRSDLDKLAVAGHVIIDLSQIVALDTSGAWLLFRLARRLEGGGGTVEWRGLQARFQPLFERVGHAVAEPAPPLAPPRRLSDWVADIGRATNAVFRDTMSLIAFFGEFLVVTANVMVRPSRWRPKALVTHIEQAGLNAVPIVALISFLVGVVLAYQGADQLRRFGAQIFTVNLVGVSVLREMGILLTAIVVAGRSGSAFTAQIGTMQVNEEVDALRALGLNPIEVLVLPRVLALVIVLPLLTFLADLAGLLGGGVMTVLLVDIDWSQYLSLLKSAVTTTYFWVGVSKAPVFAMLIALVGCFEGLRVSGSAESVGKLTTRSVVEGIFLVIVFDALFSVFFSLLNL